MILASFYTQVFYEEVAEKYIISSATKVEVGLYRYKVPSLHNWKKNTALKARCILDLINLYNDDVTMIDADATFEKYPDLLFNIPKDYDIAYHELEWDYFWHGRKGNKRELCTGTIMFRNSLISKQLLITWMEENEKNPNILEQKNLQNLLEREYSGANKINIYYLPIEYCAIVHKDGNLPPFIKDPVIKHNQISRISKRMEL